MVKTWGEWLVKVGVGRSLKGLKEGLGQDMKNEKAVKSERSS